MGLSPRRVAVLSASLFWACTGADGSAGPDAGSAAFVEAGTQPTASVGRASSEAPPELWGIGRSALHAEIAAWDIDVRPDGTGLPAGSGTHAEGAVVFANLCVSCHGIRGEGTELAGPLVSSDPEAGFRARVTGHFWPYATTLYDYIQRSMPQTAPGSLPPDEVYSLVAWLLAENGVTGTNDVIDATTLPQVRMPARDRFVPDDRVGGFEVR